MESIKALLKNPKTPALIAMLSFVAAAIGFGALHFLRADLDPLAHFGSEYALGPQGWLMELVFLLFALGMAALGVSLLRALTQRRRLARAAIAFFFLAAAAFVVDSVFPTDPLGAPATTAGTIHSTLGLLVFLSIPAAAQLLTAAVWADPRWKPARLPLAALAIASLAAFLMFPMLAATGLAGLAQRIALSAYVPWLILCARQVHRILSIEPGVPLVALTGKDLATET